MGTGATTAEFQAGAMEHTEGLAGYIRDFLVENGNKTNENGRKWSIQVCAELLQVPDKTLRRWLDQREPSAPVERGKSKTNIAAQAQAPTTIETAENLGKNLAKQPEEIVEAVLKGYGEAVAAPSPSDEKESESRGKKVSELKAVSKLASMAKGFGEVIKNLQKAERIRKAEATAMLKSIERIRSGADFAESIIEGTTEEASDEAIHAWLEGGKK